MGSPPRKKHVITETKFAATPSALIKWEPIMGTGPRIKQAIAFRAKVPLGWLVRNTPPSSGFCYVPDPDHEWVIAEPESDQPLNHDDVVGPLA